ncbi:histidine kinase dimerization/phospho-acceptor domain-containing protein [Variovorax paradoxus]|uniref:histidine kinase dimerization/phospho-acceptor domain-containing protein n=1 Tax=Variovorax paradoxus TaxID=34073 RepID=UPI0029C69773|nr:histidine kinase dimerization/phospho-acceptor domain-containing protein [Variovorax paradoxus]
MKNPSSGTGGVPARLAVLAGACAALMGMGLALRHRARSVRAAAELAAAHEARQARLAAQARQLEHDLRSPIGAMAVALELLRTSDDGAVQREAVAVLERQVARMTSLTERLHEFARGLDD